MKPLQRWLLRIQIVFYCVFSRKNQSLRVTPIGNVYVLNRTGDLFSSWIYRLFEHLCMHATDDCCCNGGYPKCITSKAVYRWSPFPGTDARKIDACLVNSTSRRSFSNFPHFVFRRSIHAYAVRVKQIIRLSTAGTTQDFSMGYFRGGGWRVVRQKYNNNISFEQFSEATLHHVTIWLL